MPKASYRKKAGTLEAGPSARDGAVLNQGGVRVDSFVYDFSVEGGATGTLSDFNRSIPAGAIVTRVFSNEETTLTSGGAATIQVQAGATDLTDALAFDTAFTGADSHALASSAEAILISAESALSITIATAAITAGKVRFYVEYLVAND